MAKKKQVSAAKSSAYLKFQSELYQALEVLLNKAQDEINDQLRGCFTRVLEIITARYFRATTLPELAAVTQTAIMQSIEQAIDPVFEENAQVIFEITKKMKQNAIVLAHVGTAEAIGRAKQKPAKYKIDDQKITKRAVEGIDGENLYARIVLSLSRIKRDILGAVQYSLTVEETIEEMLTRAFNALPKSRQVKRPKRALKQLKTKEADKKPLVDFAFGLVSEETWNKLLSDYLNEHIPRWRAPEYELDIPVEVKGEDLRYAWEYENYLTEDFIMTVRRDGEVDASKTNGIVDFQWIAVIDEKTDACCRWRDGLTTKQIEAKLKSENRNDTCRAIVPPAHFNCRCDLAPMLEDMPEGPVSNQKEFEEWLLT